MFWMCFDKIEHIFKQSSFFIISEWFRWKHIVQIFINHIIFLQIVIDQIFLRFDDFFIFTACIFSININLNLSDYSFQKEIF